MKKVPVLIGALLTLGGCTLGNFNSIYRDFDISEGKSQLIDVKQRTVLVAAAPTRDNAGNIIKDGDGNIVRDVRVCAEPSPDALTIAAFGLAGEGSSGSIAASLSVGTSEAGGSIGLRTQSIQLLRDAFYRLCEGFMSGAIGSEEYDILQRRYQNHMVGLLAIEQLTGAVRAPAITLSSSFAADAGTNLTGIVEKKELETKKLDQLKADKAAAEAKKDDGSDGNAFKDPDAKQAAIKSLDGQITAKEEIIESLDQAISNAKKAIAEGKTTASIEVISTGSVPPGVSDAVVRISSMILEADFTPQLCFSFLKYRGSGEKNETLEDFCKGYLVLLKEKASAQESIKILAENMLIMNRSIPASSEAGPQSAVDTKALEDLVEKNTNPNLETGDPRTLIIEKIEEQ